MTPLVFWLWVLGVVLAVAVPYWALIGEPLIR